MPNGNGEKPDKPTVEERLEALEKEVARLRLESNESWIVEGGFDARMEKLMKDHREWLHQHDLAIIRDRRERKRLRGEMRETNRRMREMDERLGQRIDQVSQQIKQVNEDLGKRISDMVSGIGDLIRRIDERTGRQQ